MNLAVLSWNQIFFYTCASTLLRFEQKHSANIGILFMSILALWRPKIGFYHPTFLCPPWQNAISVPIRIANSPHRKASVGFMRFSRIRLRTKRKPRKPFPTILKRNKSWLTHAANGSYSHNFQKQTKWKYLFAVFPPSNREKREVFRHAFRKPAHKNPPFSIVSGNNLRRTVSRFQPNEKSFTAERLHDMQRKSVYIQLLWINIHSQHTFALQKEFFKPSPNLHKMAFRYQNDI